MKKVIVKERGIEIFSKDCMSFNTVRYGDRIVVNLAPKEDLFIQVKTQEQWDFLSKHLGLNWLENWFKEEGGREQFVRFQFFEPERMGIEIYQSAEKILSFKRFLEIEEEEDRFVNYLKVLCRERYIKGDCFRSPTVDCFNVLEGTDFDRYIVPGGYVFAIRENNSFGLLYADGEWAQTVREVMEDGEIYSVGDPPDSESWIIRYKSSEPGRINYYSANLSSDFITLDDWMRDDFGFIKATTRQKKKLIELEVKEGYFHDLK